MFEKNKRTAMKKYKQNFKKYAKLQMLAIPAASPKKVPKTNTGQ